jgi:ubiquinone/menaquinone biosynthesis C-methylase UbiE
MSDSPHLWAKIAHLYDRTRAFDGDAEEQVPRFAARLLRERGAERVLDLGCGTGRFTLPFAEEGLRVVGADRSAEMLERLIAKRGGTPARAVRCDAYAPPFRERTFDAVFFAHVLHLVPSVEDLADAVGRVLRPGAVVMDADTTHLGDGPATVP